MNTLNANDLKVGGVTAIEAALESETEVAIAVRGERRFVVMSTAQYEHLRDCELEAAWLASQADRAAGRVRSMTAAQHIAEMKKHSQKPTGALTVQQERSGYQSDKARTTKARTARAKPAVKAPRHKSPRAR